MREFLYLWILLVSFFFDCEISVRFHGVIFMSQYQLNYFWQA